MGKEYSNESLMNRFLAKDAIRKFLPAIENAVNTRGGWESLMMWPEDEDIHLILDIHIHTTPKKMREYLKICHGRMVTDA